MKRLLNKMFFTKTENMHNVICIFGIKLKFRKKTQKIDIVPEPTISKDEEVMLNDNLYKTFASANILGKDCLWKLLKEYDFKTVLDLGAGEGVHSNIFLNNNKHVTAILADKTYFNVANYENVDLIQQDYINVQFDKKFDCVWASHILEHQPNIRIFLRKIYSDLSENGILAISVPPCEIISGGGHINIFSAGSLIYHLVSNGFDLSDMRLKIYGYNLSIICKKASNFKFNDENLTLNLREYYAQLPDYVVAGIEKYKKAHPAPWGGHERIPEDIVYKW